MSRSRLSAQRSRLHLLFALGLVVVVVAAACAAPPPDPPPPGACEGEAEAAVETHQTTDESGDLFLPDIVVDVCDTVLPLAEIDDLYAVAQEEGAELATVLETYGGQTEFVELAQRVEDAFPEEFAGARFETEGEPWIAFRDEPPSEVQSMMTSDASVELIGGRGFSEKELTEVLEQGFSTLTDLPGVATAVGSYELESGEVSVQLAPTPDSSIAEVFDEVSALPSTAPSGSSPDTIILSSGESSLDISVTVVSELPTSTNSLNGGAELSDIDGTFCTWAFSVVDQLGRTGISTADHCASRDTTYHWGDGTEMKIGESGERKNRDVAWYRPQNELLHQATNRFYIGNSKTRTVSGTAKPREGQYLARYGVTSGPKTSKVYRTYNCYMAFGQQSYCGLTAMHGIKSQGGDSGGPWYWGGTAYGIHSGNSVILGTDPGPKDLFTPVVDLPRIMNGVRVLTTPELTARTTLPSNLMPYCPTAPSAAMQKPMTFTNNTDQVKTIHAVFNDCTYTRIARVAPGAQVTVRSPSNTIFMLGPFPLTYFCYITAQTGRSYEITMYGETFSASST